MRKCRRLCEGFNEAAADAAEFFSELLAMAEREAEASMRPRQMPRNFWAEYDTFVIGLFASMRPRQMPRNFSARSAASRPGPRRFNEAAADAAEFFPGPPGPPRLAPRASMRPRQMPRNFWT